MADFFSINMASQLPFALVFLLGVLLINAGLKRLSSLNNIHPFILFLIYWIMLSVGAYSGIGPTDDLDWINLVGILSPVVGFVFFVISYLLSLFLNRKKETSELYYDENDYYEILQVSQNASADVIDAAYRRLAEAYHPNNGGSEEHFRLVNKSYEVLGNPDYKEAYDRWRQAGETSNSQYNEHKSAPDKSFNLNASSESQKIRPQARYFAESFDLIVSSITTGFILGLEKTGLGKKWGKQMNKNIWIIPLDRNLLFPDQYSTKLKTM
ncbi:MAG TPA: DnaJ domain-containing protein, partial [Syntrophomonadaceae bacterium]|nr:DnaJ domain-containing protein [Syntrophomonadaceae bacterium]